MPIWDLIFWAPFLLIQAYRDWYYQRKTERLIKRVGGVGAFIERTRRMGWDVQTDGAVTTVTGPNGVKFHIVKLEG